MPVACVFWQGEYMAAKNWIPSVLLLCLLAMAASSPCNHQSPRAKHGSSKHHKTTAPPAPPVTHKPPPTTKPPPSTPKSPPTTSPKSPKTPSPTPPTTTPTTPTASTPPPPPPPATTCPVDIVKLGVCVPLLGGILGNPTQSSCCALLGLIGLDVEVCLCAAINANVLGIININISRLDVIAQIITTCGQTVPPNLSCP